MITLYFIGGSEVGCPRMGRQIADLRLVYSVRAKSAKLSDANREF